MLKYFKHKCDIFFINFFAGNSWNVQKSSDDDWEDDLNKTNCNNVQSQVQSNAADDDWNDTPTRGTWTSSGRGTGALRLFPPLHMMYNSFKFYICRGVMCV